MRRTSRSRGNQKVTPADGKIRQSQMITTFGPGCMVDLVDRAVVIGGLEHWGYGYDGYEALDDPRLRRALIPRLKSLDSSLDLAAEGYFRRAPQGDGRDPLPTVGVKVLEFPRWFVCQGCRKLARASDAFENRGGRYRHQCRPNQTAPAVPVRFVAACKAGHLTDFPWSFFVHSEGRCERPDLYLYEGATGDISRITVHCRNCDSSRPLSQSFGLPECSGDRPWLGGRAANDVCSNQLEMLVRTASHAYFAQVVSALRLPEPNPSELTLRLRQKDVWKAVQKVESVEQLQMLAGLQDIVVGAVQGYSMEEALSAIRKEREASEGREERGLRTAEYERFLDAPDETPGAIAPRGIEFAAFRIPPDRADLPPGVGRLVIVPELREVRVQVSFSRFDSVSADRQGEFHFDERRVKPAVLTLPTGNEKWLPAAEVRGEGVFLELDPAAVHEWEGRPAVREREQVLMDGFQAEDSGGEFLGIRFYLLHSLAHLLLTAISLECGYAASAIRERIYCEPSGSTEREMAGILLSTGTTGSEGTLGGLVEEGRRLRHHLRQAWELGRLCSNDPVCAAHDPTHDADDRNLEGAACHGCLYIAESSCERFNRYLDRALVVPTIGNDPALAFFGERP